MTSLDDALLSDSEDENVEKQLTGFPAVKEEQIPLKDIPSGRANIKDEINGSWLRNQCEHYFSDSSSGVSVLDLCSALFDILSSDRDNAAIQNDLFELLGFDRFEFIEALLANRHRIVIATSESASDLSESRGEFNTLNLLLRWSPTRGHFPVISLGPHNKFLEELTERASPRHLFLNVCHPVRFVRTLSINQKKTYVAVYITTA